MRPEIIPGILTHTLEEYTSRLELVEGSGAAWVHIDVADGQFVPNITVMPHEFMGIATRLKLEAHLMTYLPERYFPDLTVAGVSRVLIHREAYKDLGEVSQAVRQARDYFAEVGLVLNPGTALEPYGDLGLDAIQCMGVNPGFSGQPILHDVYGMLEGLKSQGLRAVIAVDGGVAEENLKELQKAGASRFVMSSQLFSSPEVSSSLQYFTRLITASV